MQLQHQKCSQAKHYTVCKVQLLECKCQIGWSCYENEKTKENENEHISQVV